MLQNFTQIKHYGAIECRKHSKNRENLKNHACKGLIFSIIISMLFTSCGPKVYTWGSTKIYTKPDATAYTIKHKTLAILPPETKIEIKKNEKIENKHEQEDIETVNAQNEMYSRLLTFVQKRKMHLEIQDIETTNATLLKIGYYDKTDTKMTPKELAQALGVDAILLSSYIFSKQIMQTWVPTHFVDASIRLYDGSTGFLLYNYTDNLTGPTNPNAKALLVDKATEKAGEKSPYYRK